MDNQFQVTLLSNAAKDIFPSNEPNRFTAKLYAPIDLRGEWEVALLGVLYPFNAMNVHKVIRIGMLFAGVKETQPYTENNELTDRVRSSLDGSAHSYREIALQPGYYSTFEEFCNRLNNKILIAYRTIDKEGQPPRFRYDPIEDRISIESGDRWIKLFTDSYLSSVIGAGLSSDAPPGLEMWLTANWKGKCGPHLDRLSAMFIYTDIIKYQAVGDVQAPLLVVLPVRGQFEQHVYWHVAEPNYLPLAKNSFQTIDIRLCTETGDPFPIAPNGIVVCILSFRQKRSAV